MKSIADQVTGPCGNRDGPFQNQKQRMKNSSRGVLHFLSAFKYSLSGLRVAVSETAIRQEIYLGVGHIILLWLLNVSWQWCVCLSLLWGLVLIVEVINTAIEAVVDLVSPDFNALAGRAKDLGSTAVFLSLAMFVCAWVVVAWRYVYEAT